MSELEYKVYSLIKDNPSITSSQIAKELNISRDTVKEYIEKLKRKNMIRHIGPVRGGYWELIE